MSRDGTVPQLFEPAPQSSGRRWYWAPAVVLVLGVLSITLLVSTLWIADRKTAQDLAATRAVTDLHSAVASWHLWLEEHLTGDRWVDLDRDVRGSQDLAQQLASMLLRGGERDTGEVIKPLGSPRRRAEAEALEGVLTELRSLAEERLARPGESGAGTAVDQEFDQKFQQVKRHAEELRRLDQEHLERDRLSFRLRMGITVVIWTLIVAASLGGLWGRERHRQESEDMLRASQRGLATTLSSIGDAVVTTDLEGRVFFMNPMAEKMTGWLRNEAFGRPIDEVFRIAREDDQPVENPVARVLRSGESVGMTRHTVLADRWSKKCYSIDERAAPIRDENGKILGTVLVFRDVSRRRQTEKALRQREAELRQAQKMEAVGRLAGGIAHDVNNYLGAIRGYCEVAALKGESGEALEERMGAAIGTCDKVSALIRQLLAFSRRQPVQPEAVDLNRVVAGMERLMERLLGEDLTLETRLRPGLWSVEIDPSQMEQILVNLLVNAREAMSTGGRIEIETDNVELGENLGEDRLATQPGLARPGLARLGRFVRLTVTDTGCGIPPEARDKIFEPFFTTKAESGSSGLGLATVYAIVEQSGGFLDFESRVDEGTSFEIYLPAGDRRAAASPAPSAAPPAPTGALRVLLVEDHEEMRTSTRAYLELLGHRVRAACDGEEALAILAGEPPFDLLITDVIMPGMSGKELVDRVQQRHGDVRCLFISGYTDNVMLRHGLSQDRVHFLHKPFGFESLARKIGEVVGAPGDPPPPAAR